MYRQSTPLDLLGLPTLDSDQMKMPLHLALFDYAAPCQRGQAGSLTLLWLQELAVTNEVYVCPQDPVARAAELEINGL